MTPEEMKLEHERFMDRLLTGEGANEDTTWRARQTLKNLSDNYSNLSDRFDSLRDAVELLINAHSGLTVEADLLDDQTLAEELTKLVTASQASMSVSQAIEGATQVVTQAVPTSVSAGARSLADSVMRGPANRQPAAAPRQPAAPTRNPTRVR